MPRFSFNPLPEIAERSAEGSVRRLYADIRSVTGVPLVNLIYRHLATRQDVLDWAWGALRPHFLSGAIRAAASELRERVRANVEATMGPLDSTARPGGPAAGAADLVHIYTLANSMNLVAVTALLKAGTPAADARAPTDLRIDAAPPTELPALPALQSFETDVVARIHRLNAFADRDEPAIVASLYRHLAVWPDALVLAEQVLAPLQRRGVLLQARAATSAAANALLERHALPMPAPVRAFTEGFAPGVAQFATVTIPKMLPIGMVLQRAWQSPLPPSRHH